MNSSCARAGNATLASRLIKPGLRRFILRKPFFVRAKRSRMVVTAAVDNLRGVLYMQHLVIKDVLDEPFRDLG